MEDVATLPSLARISLDNAPRAISNNIQPTLELSMGMEKGLSTHTHMHGEVWPIWPHAWLQIFEWPLNCKLGGVNPKREFTQVGKGLLGMGSRPAARGRKEREFHRIVSPRGVTQLDST